MPSCLLVLLISAAQAAFPEALGRRRPTVQLWNWPAPEEFERRFEALDSPDQTIPLLFGDIRVLTIEKTEPALLDALRRTPDTKTAWTLAGEGSPVEAQGLAFELRRVEQGLSLRLLLESRGADEDVHLRLALGNLKDPLVFTEKASSEPFLLWSARQVAVLKVEARPVSLPPREADRAAKAYTSTLLSFEGPAFPTGGHETSRSIYNTQAGLAWEGIEASIRDPAALEGAVHRLLLTNMPPDDDRWGAAIELTNARGRTDLALPLYARYRPISRGCLNTAFPVDLVTSYIAACSEYGRTGCLLQLRLRPVLSGDGLPSVWSLDAPGTPTVDLGALRIVGLDLEPFVIGLLVRYREDDQEQIAVNLHRLGEAVAASPEAERLVSALRSLVISPDLDELNRLRASQVLAAAWQSRGVEGSAWRHRLRELELSAFSRRWLEGSL